MSAPRFAMILITSLALPVGCLKSTPDTSTALQAQGLVLSGRVADAAGAPAQAARVFVDDNATSAAVSDANGAFQVVLPEAELTRMAAAAAFGRSTFHLYFETAAGTAAMSAPVGWSERGPKALGLFTLAAPAAVQGTVVSLASGRRPEPAAAVLVQLGRARTTTDSSGGFALTGLPAGALTLAAALPKMAPATRDLTLDPGETRTLDAPLVLFPETGVHGLVVMEPPAPQAKLNAAGHPFLRTFRVLGGKTAKALRVTHDPAALATPEAAPWRDLPERFDYDFPRDGGHVLFFQFADAARTLLSDVLSVTVILDQYAAGAGFVVEDGSGTVARRDVVLTIDVPDSAYRMRIAESTQDLELKPWLAAQPVYPYTIEAARDLNGSIVGYGLRTVYLQFIDAFGFLSPVYQQTVSLELFPPPAAAGGSVFTIEGGAPVAASRLVRLDITLPPNAVEMRIFESESGGGGGSLFNGQFYGGGGGGSGGSGGSTPWLVAEPVGYYIFPSVGMKTLHVQFRAADGAVSPVYQELIRIDPFAGGGVGFVVNDGDPVSATRSLDITLDPPVTAVAFRIFEETLPSTGGSQGGGSQGGGSQGGGSQGGFGGSPSETWVTLTPNFSFETRGTGVRTIYVKYRTVDGDQSDAYARNIYVEPFPPGLGEVEINGGDPVALLSTLTVEITPPLHAVAMAVAAGTAPSENNAAWLELTPTIDLPVQGTGPKTVYVRFKSVDGTISPAIQRTIFYEPFPFGTAGVVINGGAPSTDDPNVTLTFFGLANLLALRYAESPEELLGKPFQEFVTGTTHTLTGGLGDRKVYVQFETATGEASPVYFDDITLTP